VTFSFNNGELQLQGSAPISWHKTLAKNIAALKFVTHTQLDNLAITEATQLQELTAKINESSIYFLLNRSDLKEKELPKLLDLIAMLKEVLPLSEKLNKSVGLVITGYTDGIGTMEQNRELAEKRANTVLEYMKQQAVSMPTELSPQLGKSGHKDSSQRKVSFTLLFNEE
jgi:outer membrane protein OmpA-like peptidoglycan-associated protein